NRGYTYLQLEQFDLALADFNQALQLNPNYGLAYKNRGIVRRTQADWSGAVADFQQYLVLEPNAPDRKEVEQWLGELQAGHDS
ncbi:MAG: tetratricopeptide repeat protein, partial [Anaerolineae bacterium]